MAELDFERRLERLFADLPELPDAAAFADRVERRLDAGWTARRWLIGASGVVGGVIGASQLMMSNVFRQVETAEGSAHALTSGVGSGFSLPRHNTDLPAAFGFARSVSGHHSTGIRKMPFASTTLHVFVRLRRSGHVDNGCKTHYSQRELCGRRNIHDIISLI